MHGAYNVKARQNVVSCSFYSVHTYNEE
jgi:hypothetical protein